MISHLEDAQAFPRKSNLCMETFCTRTDTHKKFAGGHKGYTSQVYYNYCPIHEPSFVNTGTRLDGLLRFFYWGVTFLISYILAFGLLALPAQGMLLLYDKLRRSTIASDFIRVAAPVTAVAFGVCSAAWLMFAIW